jgi:pyruvate/oxaloacetate carboxyltransferase
MKIPGKDCASSAEHKKTKLQMLRAGSRLSAITHYPDDIAERFIDQAAENGLIFSGRLTR